MNDWPAFDRLLASRRREIVEGFVEFVRLNSVSQNPAGVRDTARWLTAALGKRGLDSRVMDTGGNPVVYGERRVPGARASILLYCHYDTKPIPRDGWLQPDPLEPVFRRGMADPSAQAVPFADVPDDELDDVSLYARGAADDKGPIWAHLQALELMDALAISPVVNVKLVLDGEEEIGSPSFGSFAERHRELLAAD